MMAYTAMAQCALKAANQRLAAICAAPAVNQLDARTKRFGQESLVQARESTESTADNASF